MRSGLAFDMTLAIRAMVPSACAAPILAFNKPAAAGSAGAIHGKARLAPMGRSPTYLRPAARAREPVPILYPTTSRFHFGPAMIGSKPSGGTHHPVVQLQELAVEHQAVEKVALAVARRARQSTGLATASATASGTVSANSGASAAPVSTPDSMMAR